MLSKLWKDEAGFVISAELIFVATLLVIGLVTGWVAVRNAVATELTEVANAIGAVDQTYSYSGLANCRSATAGSGATDAVGSFGLTAVAVTPAGISIAFCP
jgi:Flp pilus assembly pilin Flp